MSVAGGVRGSVAAAATALLSLACVHHPRRAELHTESRDEAMRRCELALRMRFANVFLSEASLGRLSTDDRVGSGFAITRMRAYVAITPGEFGWAAEITVLRERLDADRSALVAPSARWEFDGRDRALEKFLAEELERPPAESSPFAPTSRP